MDSWYLPGTPLQHNHPRRAIRSHPQTHLFRICAAEMVSLEIIHASNDRIRTSLQAGLVAVFVGATNGVGETTVRQFVKHVAQPRVYIIGRSQEAGDRITDECRALNPEGTFMFIRRDTSLMRNVDEICNELASKEDVINLLFLTIGTLQIDMSELAQPRTNPPRFSR